MNKEKYTLQEVTTPALEREWLDFPKRIYKGNRNWVCPLDTDIRKVFDPARNEQFAVYDMNFVKSDYKSAVGAKANEVLVNVWNWDEDLSLIHI